VVEPGPRLEAELAYQRALAALHEARAELADVAAARRRLAYDRVRLEPADALGRDQLLAARFAEASGRAERLREAAAALREQVRRLSDDATSEPAEVPDDLPGEGFEQPLHFKDGE
jgi:hypothetical protein